MNTPSHGPKGKELTQWTQPSAIQNNFNRWMKNHVPTAGSIENVFPPFQSKIRTFVRKCFTARVKPAAKAYQVANRWIKQHLAFRENGRTCCDMFYDGGDTPLLSISRTSGRWTVFCHQNSMIRQSYELSYFFQDIVEAAKHPDSVLEAPVAQTTEEVATVIEASSS